MKIYIDKSNRVHGTPFENCTIVDTNVFDDMDITIAECYCYYPADDTHNEFIQAWATNEEIMRRQQELDAAQKEYEREQEIAELKSQNETLMQCLLEMSEVVYA